MEGMIFVFSLGRWNIRGVFVLMNFYDRGRRFGYCFLVCSFKSSLNEDFSYSSSLHQMCPSAMTLKEHTCPSQYQKGNGHISLFAQSVTCKIKNGNLNILHEVQTNHKQHVSALPPQQPPIKQHRRPPSHRHLPRKPIYQFSPKRLWHFHLHRLFLFEDRIAPIITLIVYFFFVVHLIFRVVAIVSSFFD